MIQKINRNADAIIPATIAAIAITTATRNFNISSITFAMEKPAGSKDDSV